MCTKEKTVACECPHCNIHIPNLKTVNSPFLDDCGTLTISVQLADMLPAVAVNAHKKFYINKQINKQTRRYTCDSYKHTTKTCPTGTAKLLSIA